MTAVDPRQVFLDAVTTALDDYDAAFIDAPPRLQALVAASESEPPHVTQLPPLPEYGASPSARRIHKVAALRFMTEVVAALPAGVEPDASVASHSGRLTVQTYGTGDFGLDEAAAFARQLGLGQHDSYTREGSEYHSWFSGDGLSSALTLNLVVPAAVAE